MPRKYDLCFDHAKGKTVETDSLKACKLEVDCAKGKYVEAETIKACKLEVKAKHAEKDFSTELTVEDLSNFKGPLVATRATVKGACALEGGAVVGYEGGSTDFRVVGRAAITEGLKVGSTNFAADSATYGTNRSNTFVSAKSFPVPSVSHAGLEVTVSLFNPNSVQVECTVLYPPDNRYRIILPLPRNSPHLSGRRGVVGSTSVLKSGFAEHFLSQCSSLVGDDLHIELRLEAYPDVGSTFTYTAAIMWEDVM